MLIKGKIWGPIAIAFLTGLAKAEGEQLAKLPIGGALSFLGKVWQGFLPLWVALIVWAVVWVVWDYVQLRQWARGYHYIVFRDWLNHSDRRVEKRVAESHIDGYIAVERKFEKRNEKPTSPTP